MAKLDLLPRKEFVITLESGEKIMGKYSLWSVKRFCDKKKLTLSQLNDYLNADNIGLGDLCDIILGAVEHSQREAGQPFKYTDFDVCNWIDELGGITSDDYARLIAHAASQVEEKKTET